MCDNVDEMNTTAKSLYDYFEGSQNGLTRGVVHDLFGLLNWSDAMKYDNEKTLGLFLGLYKGLYLFDVPHQEIHRCFQCNKLDDLVHTKYSLHGNRYYTEFCDLSIVIGRTFYQSCQNSEQVEISDANMPLIYSTLQPPFHFIKCNRSICTQSVGTLDYIISQKIIRYKHQDRESGRNITQNFVSVSDVKRLLKTQENKCYVCSDIVITEEWQPNCLYQFTLDRIDNSLPHNKDNVLISCLYCNCYGFILDSNNVSQHKLCKGGCHQIKRNISRTRYNVPRREWEQLKLYD
jgi:hypothetical protein